eukprot:655531-Pelagomonas_calceolata.AAC.19
MHELAMGCGRKAPQVAYLKGSHCDEPDEFSSKVDLTGTPCMHLTSTQPRGDVAVLELRLPEPQTWQMLHRRGMGRCVATAGECSAC